MFGYVTASIKELSQEDRLRYRSVYCGICRRIGKNAAGLARLCLNYDMVFLALTLSSLYEPEETSGAKRCVPHMIHPQEYVDSTVISYAADMDIALSCYSALDHWQDDHRPDALVLNSILEKHYPAIAQRYPRQCRAIEDGLQELGRLEKENCPNPDLPANAFGSILAEIFVCQEDHWAGCLRQVGHSLGRFIYLADAMVDYQKDSRHGSYNPFIAMGDSCDPSHWESYLTAEMADCTRAFELLPLVQDKSLLDNILYSGVWLIYRQKQNNRHRRTSND